MHRIGLGIILALALAVRLTVLAAGLTGGGTLLTPDSADYIETARTLAAHGRFARGPGGPPEVVRTPGYPLLLAGVWRTLAGPAEIAKAPAADIIAPIAGVQCVLDMVLVGLTYLLGLRLGGRTVALVAAGIQACTAVAIAASVRTLADGPFALVVTAAILCLLAYLTGRRRRALLGAAVLLGVAAYIRPIGLLLPIPAAVVLGAKWGLKPAGALCGIVAVCIAPWIARNWVVADYRGFSAIGAVNLYDYGAVAVWAHQAGVSEENMRLQARLNIRIQTLGASQAQTYQRRGRDALTVLSEHPALFVGLHLRACPVSLLPGATDVLETAGVTVGQRGTLAVLKRRGLTAAVRHYFGDHTAAVAMAVPMVALLATTYLGALITAVRRGRPRMGAAGWLGLLTALTLLAAAGSASHPRFRVPVAPLLSATGAAGLVWLAGRVRRRRNAGAATQQRGHKP